MLVLLNLYQFGDYLATLANKSATSTQCIFHIKKIKAVTNIKFLNLVFLLEDEAMDDEMHF